MGRKKKAEEFLKVIEDHRALIHKISNSYAFMRQDREDLFQEIVLQLWRSFDRYDDRYKYSTWIYRIALNVAISNARKLKKHRLESSEGSDMPDHAEDEKKEQIELLYRFIGSMNKMDRALMILFLEGTPHKEIADILGITETNVSTKIARLKKRLQKQFSQIN